MRVPGHAPHGDHTGKAGARVQHDGDHHGTQRIVPCLHQKRPNHTTDRKQPERPPGAIQAGPRGGAVHQGDHHHQVGFRGQRNEPVYREARHHHQPDVPDHRACGTELRHAAGRDRFRLLRQAENGI